MFRLIRFEVYLLLYNICVHFDSSMALIATDCSLSCPLADHYNIWRWAAASAIIFRHTQRSLLFVLRCRT